MIRFRFLVAAALLRAPLLFAVETQSWVHNDQADFEKGTLKSLSLRSDGRLSLAPAFRELADASAAYLWALAVDSKGTVYAGGGGPSASTCRITAVPASGPARTFAELPGLQIQALAVDKRDRVYAATAPDGKVYRLDASGKSEVFYDPKAKYIWAIAFNSTGDLFVATGDSGEIHRVTPDGKGSVFFRTEETHARSMAVDAKDNIIVGTEPGGLILRIGPNGEGFVLYQGAKREVTAVAVTPDGIIYAAAAGNKAGATSSISVSMTPAPPPPSPPAPAGAPAARATVQTAPAPPSAPSQAPSISGGSELYRIGPDGYPQRYWTHPQDVVYAIAFDGTGRPVLGTGNRGSIYRVNSRSVSTLLINAEPTQVTALVSAPGGRLYAATGNVGKVYSIGPELEKQGTYESDPLDVGAFAYWGRVQRKAAGTVLLETRTGNLDRPQKNWSPWAAVDPAGRIVSPSARFLQYRLTLTGNAELRQVELAYMAKNVPPQIEEVDITPANYRFSAPTTLVTAATQTITLPPLGQRRRPTVPTISLDTASGSTTMQYARGSAGIRWAATDVNGDELLYKVEIRGLQEREWKLLKDKIKERYLTFDATAFADGEYIARVTASDSPSNAPERALTAELESDSFIIDNTPPAISGLAGTRTGAKVTVKWHAKDARSIVQKAEYSVNGGEWVVAEPTTRLSDAPELSYAATFEAPAEGTVAVRVTDEYDNQSVDKVIVR